MLAVYAGNAFLITIISAVITASTLLFRFVLRFILKILKIKIPQTEKAFFKKLSNHTGKYALLLGILLNIGTAFIGWHEAMDIREYGLPFSVYSYGYPLDTPPTHHFHLFNEIPNLIFWFFLSYSVLWTLLRFSMFAETNFSGDNASA